MNLYRFSQLQSDQLIYHYCSPETFLLICTNKTIRFSDILTMNDSLEMQWGYRLWEKIASRRSNEDPRWNKLKSDIERSLSFTVPLVACFANQGDILSQWRAYADDGTGFAIGLNSNLVNALPAPLMHVEYRPEEQEKEIEEFAASLIGATDNEAYDDLILSFICNLLGYKNPAFIEEGEVRLVHSAVKDPSVRILTSIGGLVDDTPVPPQPLKFQMRSSTPSPYIDLSFSVADQPISEVIMGPKNYADPGRVRDFLCTMGFSATDVKQSVASYR